MYGHYLLVDSRVRDRVVNVLSALKLDPQHPLEVLVRPFEETRSENASRRYWAILGEWSKVSGYTKGELHVICRKEFLGYNRYEFKDGSVIEELKSTKDLKTKPFHEYVEQVEMKAAQEGALLPMLY